MKQIKFSIAVVMFVLFFVATKESLAAGIYGCVWNPQNPPGQQCMLKPDRNACTDGDVPGVCDAPDFDTCTSFTGACITPHSLEWGCDAGGNCVPQQGGGIPTEAQCKAYCKPKVMYNCINTTIGLCQEVYTQLGQYITAEDCTAKCVPPPPSGTGKVLCSDGESIYTAIGCIPITTMWKISVFIITWGLGIGGGWAILLFIVSGVQIMTSSGDPSKLQGGKELLISAISGVIMLIFCIFLLRTIGVNILGLF